MQKNQGFKPHGELVFSPLCRYVSRFEESNNRSYL